jgi:hypothetical protein
MPTGMFAGCAENMQFAGTGTDVSIITSHPQDSGGSAAGLP